MKSKATYDSAVGTITHSRGAWSDTFPVADLGERIAFYRSQQERFPDHAESYADDVRALEAITKEIRLSMP
jgi:hypothetical protein